jgi:hypothetical protein
MKRQRRYRSTSARAPAEPRDRSPWTRQIPTGDDVFNWRSGEMILGPEPKRDLDTILKGCWEVDGPRGRRK